MRPFMRAAVSTAVSRLFSSLKRRMPAASRPKALPSRTPDTESVSSVSAVMSTTVSCTARHFLWPAWPVRCVNHANTGTIANDRTVSCQLMRSIATSELTRMTTFASESWATWVMTSSMPETSFVRRDWISPVRVAVKNRSGIRLSRSYRSPAGPA
jgi:hypothetical protein